MSKLENVSVNWSAIYQMVNAAVLNANAHRINGNHVAAQKWESFADWLEWAYSIGMSIY